MEVGFVDQIRLTQQKIFGKLKKKNSCSVEGRVKLHWNYTVTIYISIDYTQSIPTLAILWSANILCCCCYLGSYLVESQKFVLVFFCLLVAWFVSLSTRVRPFHYVQWLHMYIQFQQKSTHNEIKYDYISNRLWLCKVTTAKWITNESICVLTDVLIAIWPCNTPPPFLAKKLLLPI